MRLARLFVLAAAADLAVWADTNAWTSLGPDGGSVRSLAVDPNDPTTLYASTSAGLYKSANGGASWSLTSPLPPGSGTVTSLVVDPRNAGTLYAATKDASSGIPCQDYVFKSTDGGASWRALKSGVPCGLPLPPVADPHVGLGAPIAIDPQDSKILYSGSYSDIFKSTDGGETWMASNAGLPPHCCITQALTIYPQDPRIVYASTSRGIFKSRDRGETWTGVHVYVGKAADPGEQQFGILAIDPKDSNTLYGGTFKSTDGGISWSALGPGLPGSYIGALVIDPRNTSILYSATGYGVFKSADAGASWRAANSGIPNNAVTGLAIDPASTGTVYASLESGVYKTSDAAVSWSAFNNGIKAVAVSSVAVDLEDPATIYANAGGIIKTNDEGASWNKVSELYLLGIDPRTPATLYAASRPGPDGIVNLSRSTDGGVKWSPANSGLPAALCHSLASLAFDARNKGTVYAAIFSGGCGGTHGGGVWKSADGGASWKELDSRPDGGGAHGLAVDPVNSDTLYAWNGKGLFKSTGRGAGWNQLRAGFVSSLQIDPFNSSTLYAVLNDESVVYATGDKPGVYKSTDGGASWSVINAGLPTILLNLVRTDEITSLIIDAHDSSILYAATGVNGVYQSIDGGKSWNPLNSGLTSLSVSGLALDDSHSRLYAATAGGVFAIRISPE